MEVAKYIGLFLLKNKACYIHGLGNLELKKRPATYNGDTLQAGAWEIALTPSGSIDDNLANFIATNELISISKASNALRDYSTEAKADLEAGKDVVIPAIGKFTMADGKIKFLTDPHLQYTPPPIPTLRSGRNAQQDAPAPNPGQYQPPHRDYIPQNQQNQPSAPPAYPGGRQLNWNRIFMVICIALVVVVGGIYAIRFVKYRSLSNTSSNTSSIPTDTVSTPQPVDSAALKVDSTASDSMGTITMKDGKLYFKVIIDNFTTRKKAEKKARLMISYGHQAEVIAEDSASFDVVMPVIASPADTAKILDSMRRTYNPAGVYIY